jgi:hypothetical protein
MSTQLIKILVFALLLLGTISCGGGGGSSSPSVAVNGTVVDPPIVGAKFVELDPAGNVVQESSPSDSQGKFSFPRNLTRGNTVEMETSGKHGGTPFLGLLKLKIKDPKPSIIVSPVTTIVAEGLTELETVSLLESSGANGITENDVEKNPLDQLAEKTTADVTNQDLQQLIGNLAIGATLALHNNNIQDSTFDSTVATIAATIENTILNTTDIAAITTNTPAVALEDIIKSATAIQNHIVNTVDKAVRSGGDLTTELNAACADISETLTESLATLASTNDPRDYVKIKDDGSGNLSAEALPILKGGAFMGVGFPQSNVGPQLFMLLHEDNTFEVSFFDLEITWLLIADGTWSIDSNRNLVLINSDQSSNVFARAVVVGIDETDVSWQDPAEATADEMVFNFYDASDNPMGSAYHFSTWAIPTDLAIEKYSEDLLVWKRLDFRENTLTDYPGSTLGVSFYESHVDSRNFVLFEDHTGYLFDNLNEPTPWDKYTGTWSMDSNGILSMTFTNPLSEYGHLESRVISGEWYWDFAKITHETNLYDQSGNLVDTFINRSKVGGTWK